MALKKRRKQKPLARRILCCIALVLVYNMRYRHDCNGMVLAVLICCASMDLILHGGVISYADSLRNISILILAFGLKGVVC